MSILAQSLRNFDFSQLESKGSGSGWQSGRFRLNTDVTDEQAKEMGASVTREQFERYMNDFVPFENRLIGSLGDDEAGSAARGSSADALRARAALDRMRERYGTSLTGGQRRSENRQAQLDKSLGSLSATNMARQLDEDRDYNLRGSLLNLGNNLRSSAVGGLADASISAQNRENAHNQAMAQYEAQKSQQQAQTVSTIAGLGVAAFAF